MNDGPAKQASEPFVRLGQRAKEELAKAGLQLVGYSVDPDLDGGPTRGRMAVVLDANASSDPEMDAALAGMLEATAEEDRERRAQEAREQLGSLGEVLRNPKKGILDDD